MNDIAKLCHQLRVMMYCIQSVVPFTVERPQSRASLSEVREKLPLGKSDPERLLN